MRVLLPLLIFLIFPAQAFSKSPEETLRLFSESVLAGKESASSEDLLLQGDDLFESAAVAIDQSTRRQKQKLALGLQKSKKEIRKRAAKKLRQGLQGIPADKPHLQKALVRSVRKWQARKNAFFDKRYSRNRLLLEKEYENSIGDITNWTDQVYRYLQKDPLGKDFFATMSIETITPDDTREMSYLGIDTYRISLDWRWIQKSPQSSLDWSGFDYVIRTTASWGIRVLPAFHSTAEGFGSDWRELPTATVLQRSGWRRFVEGAVRRYGPEGSFWRANPSVPRMPIDTWQIWNEANDHWFTQPVDPRRYTALLRQSAEAIRSVDPQAKIMASSFFGPSGDRPGQSLSPETFLQDMHSAGADPYYDFISFHPYSTSSEEMIGRINRFVRFYRGFVDKPLWITEIGWQSDHNTAFGVGDASLQARELQEAYGYLLRHHRRLRIQMVSWFAWKDAPPSIETCLACYGSGLFYSGDGFSRKPAWYELREIIRSTL